MNKNGEVKAMLLGIGADSRWHDKLNGNILVKESAGQVIMEAIQEALEVV